MTRDTRPPNGYMVHDQRADETQAGKGTTLTMISISRPVGWAERETPESIAAGIGLANEAWGLIEWDLIESVTIHGLVVLMMLWSDETDARSFEKKAELLEGARLKRIRIVRDYTMRDRRESPQYYPPVVHQAVDTLVNDGAKKPFIKSSKNI